MRAQIEQLSENQRDYLAARLNELGVADSGERTGRLTAWVVGEDSVNESEMRLHLTQQLPSAMIPHQFVFVDELPKTRSGKTDRQALGRVPHAAQRKGEESSETEKVLMAVCAEVVGHANFGLDGSFYDAGGDSLTCISFVASLRNRDIDLLATDVIYGRTLRDLAALASTRSDGAFRTEVLHQGDGSGTIVFASAYGESAWYRERIEGELDQSFSQIAVVAGSESEESWALKVEEIAASEVEHILRFDPAGPHVVVGFCWSGAVAFEIARGLSQRTGTSPILALVETMADPAWYNASKTELALRYAAGIPLRLLRSFRTHGPAALYHAVRRRLFPAAAVPSTPSKDSRWNTQQLRYINILEGYRPKKWSGQLILFRARSEQPLVWGCYADPNYGWQHLVKGGPKVVKVDGGHLTCLSDVAVKLNSVIKTLARSQPDS